MQHRKQSDQTPSIKELVDAVKLAQQAKLAQQTRSVRPRGGAEILGCSVSTLWRWVKERPDFPAPRHLSRRCTVFDEGELIAWRDAHASKAA